MKNRTGIAHAIALSLAVLAGGAGAKDQNTTQSKMPDLAIQALIQPRLEIRPKSPYLDSTRIRWDLHRAELTLRSKPEEKAQKPRFEFGVDFTDKNLLQDAYVALSVRRYFRVTAGRFKPDFGQDFSIGNQDLLLIDRSRASTFFKAEMNGSRLYGLEFSGKLPLGFSYAADYMGGPNWLVPQFDPFEFGAATIGWSHGKKIDVRASVRTEMIGVHPLLEHRTWWYDLAASGKPIKPLYFECEYFLGDAQLPDYLPDNRIDSGDFASLSLRFLAAGEWKAHKRLTILPVASIEHSDGYTIRETITGGVLCHFGKRFDLYINGATTWSEKADRFANHRVGVQVSYREEQGF
jgi:hypothetical protein